MGWILAFLLKPSFWKSSLFQNWQRPKFLLSFLGLFSVFVGSLWKWAVSKAHDCRRTKVTGTQHRLVSDLQNCNASYLPCARTWCFAGSNYGQTNWDSDQQRLTREKTSGRHNLISADVKILASSSLNHRAAVFSLVRLEKLRPALIPLGDSDEGWTYAKLHQRQWSPEEDSSGRCEHLETEQLSPERKLQCSTDWLSPE